MLFRQSPPEGRCSTPLVRPSVLPGLLQRIGELERDLEGLQGELQKYQVKQESIQKELAEKAKVTSQLWGVRERAGGSGHGTYVSGRPDVWDEGQRAPGTQAVRAGGQNLPSFAADPRGRR